MGKVECKQTTSSHDPLICRGSANYRKKMGKERKLNFFFLKKGQFLQFEKNDLEIKDEILTNFYFNKRAKSK